MFVVKLLKHFIKNVDNYFTLLLSYKIYKYTFKMYCVFK